MEYGVRPRFLETLLATSVTRAVEVPWTHCIEPTLPCRRTTGRFQRCMGALNLKYTLGLQLLSEACRARLNVLTDMCQAFCWRLINEINFVL